MSGRIFKGTESVDAISAIRIQNDILDHLQSNGIKAIAIGSVGHRDESYIHNDIDVAVEASDIDELYEFIYKLYGESTEIIKKESLYVVSMKHEFDTNKYIQVDFILMHNEDWTKFRYFCSEWNESRYKVGAKIMLTNMLINHCVDLLYIGIDEGHHAVFDYSPIGLLRTVFAFTNDGVVIKETEFVTDDPSDIVLMLFGEDGKEEWLNSVESLWEAVHNNSYRYPERLRQIEHNWFVSCYKKGWRSIRPEDFEMKYWSVEEINKQLLKELQLHKINAILNKDEKSL